MNQSFLHIYMKNMRTLNLRKLFKNLQKIKIKKNIYFILIQY